MSEKYIELCKGRIVLIMDDSVAIEVRELLAGKKTLVTIIVDEEKK